VAKLTASQAQRAVIRQGLMQAGYASLLNPSGPDTIGSLRPAIEAYLAFRSLKSDTPLEDLLTQLALPRCCNRPDVDYTLDGEPMANRPGANGVQPPSAKAIEWFLSGAIDPLAAPRGVTFWRHDPIRIRWQFQQLAAHGTDRNMHRCLRVWQNICGVRFGIVQPSQHTNITVQEARLGMGILGMAQLPGRGQPENATLWNRMSIGHRWTVELWNTTFWHELGHNLGSGHLRGGLMNPSHIPGLRKPQPVDIQWARQHYPNRGDERPDDTDLVTWQDAPTPTPTPTPGPTPPVPPVGDSRVWVSTSCVIRESADGKTAIMTGTFQRS
jgi:hypothetical protein